MSAGDCSNAHRPQKNARAAPPQASRPRPWVLPYRVAMIATEGFKSRVRFLRPNLCRCAPTTAYRNLPTQRDDQELQGRRRRGGAAHAHERGTGTSKQRQPPPRYNIAPRGQLARNHLRWCVYHPRGRDVPSPATTLTFELLSDVNPAPSAPPRRSRSASRLLSFHPKTSGRVRSTFLMRFFPPRVLSRRRRTRSEP